MTSTSFAVVTGGAAAASAAASAALNASTSASLARGSQDFWALVARDPHAGPVAVAVILVSLVATVAVMAYAVVVLWRTR